MLFRSKKIIGYEDLINQYYIDLASGLLKFGAWDKSIGKAMYHSFRYAAVGGIDEVYDVSFGVKAKDEESKEIGRASCRERVKC